MNPLRDYQEKVIDDLRQGLIQGHLRQILASSTGSGKTVMIANVIHRASQKGNKTLFIVDRIELIEQAVQHLREMNLNVGVLQAENTNYSSECDVIVASIQSIRSRRAPPSGFIVIDECHILHKAHIELMQSWDNVPVIGLSATPLRKDLGQYFTRLVRGPSIQELTEQGFLVPARAYCPSAQQMHEALKEVATRRGDYAEKELAAVMNSKNIIGDVISHWQEKAHDRPTLVFAVNIAHSKQIVHDFTTAGIRAEHLDYKTDKEQRKEIIHNFRNGKIQILSSVQVLGVGFDVPVASCAILARPTLSEALHIQQVGRVLRPDNDKHDALILDHSGNCLRFGLPVDFIVPELSELEHKATTKEKRNKKKAALCQNCEAVLPAYTQTCPECGTDIPSRTNDVQQTDGRLIEYGSDDDGTASYTEAEKQNWYQAIVWSYQHTRVNQPLNCAYYAYQYKFNEKPKWSWRSLDAVEPTEEQARWMQHYFIRKRKGWGKKEAAIKRFECPHCGGHKSEEHVGTGPHHKQLRCADCGRHIQWLKKPEPAYSETGLVDAHSGNNWLEAK